MLYQEVRPKSLDDIVGNKSTIKGLQKLLRRKSEDRPHAILLTGPKGCGKTTIGRILASAFGSREGSILKFNASKDRGIDKIRDILSNLSFRPIGGGTVTYILDECHQITKDAQNALLEVEDIPEHVYFIFCTTDPQKLIPTLKNRCSEYTVEPLRSKDIRTILERACKEKDLNIENDVLEIISKNCDRTPRTALVLLEKVMDLTDPDEIADAIVAEIEIQEGGEFFTLCKMLLILPEKRRKQWQMVLREYERLNQEPEQVRHGILTFLRKQLLKLDPIKDLDYAEDIARTMEILSTNTFHGGKSLMAVLLMKVCLGISGNE
jgi:DNA polymerase III gamma/tau subunit